MSRKAVVSVYRTLMRQAARMKKRGEELEIRKPVSDQWGNYGYSETGLVYQGNALAQMLGPGGVSVLRHFPGAEKLDGTALQRTVRDNFRAHADAAPEHVPRLVGQALTCLRGLLEQQYLHRCSSSAVTDGVRVDATSKFSTSGMAYTGRHQNLFSYRIRVTNLREEPIQLMGREWTIKNDRGTVVVHVPHIPGNAVVGQQPIIPPNDCFEYVSGTDLDTPAGLQSGKLEIAVVDKSGRTGRTFMAAVAPFAHMRPDVAAR
ncbi:hypothetical protein CHLRE_09g387134v5 [Chlamydomonas reinhardtii]|uniref:Uncharacterized protein n=1 Tax=Chlamydomonas reinhardtii TaxID=3055 RepID=A8J116_CHLRE|nr:uncharacterized protein CHLRE_09g387134v5 [Chlamydomonas reinhardtii]PNW78697.1 hypothetical protein CHLRE_09g387134v5 [Chlamydomonas reinhardtii]|eukprot:XP_001695031.1 predicted protein [Chlamydomonas reinhardtii]